jgi:pyruvate,water dikinase
LSVSDSDRTVALKDINDTGKEKVGPKAYNLGRLTTLDFNVPDGFCITALVYREYIQKSGLFAKLTQDVREMAMTPDNKKRLLLKDLRDEVARMELASDLKEEIAARYNRLGDGLVVVRSSAASEDLPGHSFAGQHGTYFARGLEECLEHIKHCWASLWSDRAFFYRERNGFDHIKTEMSVIVQILVPAESSGVIFTTNPLTNDEDEIIIEACYGLGESLVSGKVTPDSFMISKDNLDIIDRKVAAKTSEVAACQDDRGFLYICERRIDGPRADNEVINIDKARRLARLALEIENVFAAPQDIEWAYVGDQIFVLQSRNVTTIGSKKQRQEDQLPEDRQIWSNINSGEVMPDVMTPATWSMGKRLGAGLFDVVFGKIGLKLGDNFLFNRIAGRLYFNLNTLVSGGKKVPGLKNVRLTEVLGGQQDKILEEQIRALTEEDLPDFQYGPMTMILSIPRFMYWVFSHKATRGFRFIKYVDTRIDDLAQTDISKMTDSELAEHIGSRLDEAIDDGLEVVSFGLTSVTFFARLDKFCKENFSDNHKVMANSLISGIGGMASVKSGLDLWRLALLADKIESVKKAIIDEYPYADTRSRLEETPEGKTFFEEWDLFMREHGHHTRGEIEFYNPRWSEMPDYVLDMIRSYLMSLPDSDPLAGYHRRGEESEALASDLRSRIKNPFKKAMFNYYLEQAKKGSTVRENGKSALIRFLSLIRKRLLELGQRFVDRGILKERDDIFFFEFEEMPAIASGENTNDIQAVVQQRKREYKQNLAITPPPVIIGGFDAERFIPAEPDRTKKEFTGIPVSPGVVRGPARVVLRSDSGEKIKPGEILVAPFTDPGWTPYFTPAAAIVMDMGGLLSHGSIIAREYGIPAVVNVGPVTTMIKTGQMIEVDGDHGRVRILGKTESGKRKEERKR